MRIKKTLLLTAMMAAGALGALHGASACRLGVGMECLDRDLWKHGPAMPHLKELGIRPLLQGVLLWIIISAASLAYILLK